MSSPTQTSPEEELDPDLARLHDRIDELEARADRFEAIARNLLTVNHAPADDDLVLAAAELAPAQHEDLDDLRADLRTARDDLHRERARLARRVAALEEEIGITATDALAIAEGGPATEHLSKLGRLVRYGPEGVNDNPTATMFRARDLVCNWNRWGTVRNDALGTERRLASRKHDLKTRLEDARDEHLAWLQVYRAMELVADWSEGSVTLEEGGQDEGSYVLVHHLDDGGDTDQ